MSAMDETSTSLKEPVRIDSLSQLSLKMRANEEMTGNLFRFRSWLGVAQEISSNIIVASELTMTAPVYPQAVYAPCICRHPSIITGYMNCKY